jgi:glycosyltransferase involved in cell wall biosynthesis
MCSLGIVIPAFNEEFRLALTLTGITQYLIGKKWSTDIVVVDDGSSDRTAELVQDFARAYPSVRLVRNGRNRGKGFSVRRGMQEVQGEILLMMDADFAVRMEQCQELIDAILRGADIAIGSRTLDPRLQRVMPPLHRQVSSLAFRLLVRLLLDLQFKDTQCGVKAFNRKAAQTLFATQKIDGWAFDPEILSIANSLGYRIAEIPVETFHHEGSKVRWLHSSSRMFLDLLKIRRDRRGGPPHSLAGRDDLSTTPPTVVAETGE